MAEFPTAVTLRWEDPEDAAYFLALHEDLRRLNRLPDASRDALLELVGEGEVVKGGSEDGGDG